MRWYTNVKQLGNFIVVRGYDNGQYFQDRIEYRPTLYLKSDKPTEFKTLEGEYAKPIQPGTLKESKEFIEKYTDIDGFDIYGNEWFLYQYISDQYPEETIEFDIKKIKLITLDIETTSENGFPDPETCEEQILLITIQEYSTKKIITWGSRDFKETDPNYTYIRCRDEEHLLRSFLAYWEDYSPEVVTGWALEFFDMPYIVGRMSRVLNDKEIKRLSPWNCVKAKQAKKRNDEYQTVYDITGVTILDYMDLYKKYSFKNPENYRLDTIAFNELGERKLDHTEYETFKDFYTNNFQLYTEYNRIDCVLVDKLEDTLHLIELAMTMAYTAKVNYGDVYFQVRMWDMIIYNHLRSKNIVIPQKKKSITKENKFSGAYVKEPIPGSYDYVVSLDLTSLYPHLMMEFGISPETLVDTRFPNISVDSVLNEEIDTTIYPEYSICPNGSMYRKDVKGFIPELLQSMFDDRKAYKNKMLELKIQYEKTPSPSLLKEISRYSVMEKGLKVCLNSCYGSFGNEYFRFYDLRNAEAVTYSGQLAIRWIEKKLNTYFNSLLKTENVDYGIYSDTDSEFLNMKPLVDKIFKNKNPTDVEIVDFLNKIFTTTIQDYINDSYKELATYLNVYEHKLHMKLEKIASRAIFLRKKKYIINVWENEGVRFSKPKLYITGIEAIKSSTPGFCRDKLKTALELVMNSDEQSVIDFIAKTREEFNTLSPEEISFPRTVSYVDKFKCNTFIYSSGTPIHSRGALLYNHYIKDKKLTNKYSLINNGERVKYCYLKLPNPIRENVITFIQKFPTELGLNSYVDYNVQFDKSFIQPLKVILDVVGWDVEKRNTLASFFT